MTNEIRSEVLKKIVEHSDQMEVQLPAKELDELIFSFVLFLSLFNQYFQLDKGTQTNKQKFTQ